MIETFYSQFMGPNDTVFDVGSQYGGRINVFVKLAAKVVGVEPVNMNFDKLATQFAGNPKVHLVHKAMGAAPGKANIRTSIAYPEHLASLSDEFIDVCKQRCTDFWPPNDYWNTTQEVEVTTLDALIQEFGKPNFIKIDTEGYEQQVLAGLSQPVRGLSFEFLSVWVSAAISCVDRCAAIGMTSFNLSTYESFVFESPWCSAEEMKLRLSRLDNIDNKLFGDVYARG
jgi:FkbM family methyltransferase